MPYTRRDLIRDAALISATGVVAGSPFILSCNAKPPAPPFSGVRVFFSGAWIFCRAPSSRMDYKDVAAPARMYAIARDMQIMQMSHKFPYGIWTDTNFDDKMPSLPEGQYTVTADNFKPNATVCSMFQSAACGPGPFRYFANSRNEIKLDTTRCGLRIISLPVPTRILPTAYLTKADFVPADTPSSILSDPPTGANYSVKGLPTVHILEYEKQDKHNDVCLHLSGVTTAGAALDPVTVTSSQHFHVHTIPPNDGMCSDHGPAMFSNLLQIFYRTILHADPSGNVTGSKSYLCECDLQLVNSDPSQLEPGPNVPPDITLGELEIIPPTNVPNCNYEQTRNYHLASCSGSGFGVDGDVTG